MLIRTGDQILEYNGTDLRSATAEEAAFELAKPLDKVGVLVQYNLQRKCWTNQGYDIFVVLLRGIS